MSAAIYESASPATELLAERGALPYRHCDAVPDYWAELPEDKAPTGRVLVRPRRRESMSDGGAVGIRTMSGGGRARTASTSATGHRVQRVVMDGGAVIGVEADHGRRGHPPRRRAQGGDLRDRRLHPRRRAAPNFLGVPASTAAAPR